MSDLINVDGVVGNGGKGKGTTKIEWTGTFPWGTHWRTPGATLIPGFTFNGWWGCDEVSPACAFCYARDIATHYGHDVWGKYKPRVFMKDSYWKNPPKWNRHAQKLGTPLKVFAFSMGDVFEKLPADHPQFTQMRQTRERLWEMIDQTRWLNWLLTTKRPENIAEMVPWTGAWPRNVWLLTTVEKEEYTWRAEKICEFDAVVRGISAEPLLGYLKALRKLYGDEFAIVDGRGVEKEVYNRNDYPVSIFENGLDVLPDQPYVLMNKGPLHWCIGGGESGPNARMTKLMQARELLWDASQHAVSFFWKQWGEWGPDPSTFAHILQMESGAEMRRCGKKNTGRMLDNRIYNQMPFGVHPSDWS